MIQNQQMAPPTNTYQLVMDPRLGLIVGTMTPASQQTTIPTQSNVLPSPTTTTTPKTRSRKKGGQVKSRFQQSSM